MPTQPARRLPIARRFAVRLLAGFTLAVPPLRFRIHRWEITDEAVYTLSGWLVREWRIAPISRVQTVDTEQHAGLLSSLGLDPMDIVANLTGGGGGAGGALGGLGGILGR